MRQEERETRRTLREQEKKQRSKENVSAKLCRTRSKPLRRAKRHSLRDDEEGEETHNRR